MPHPQVLRDMALFVEVARRRSFSQAAVALGMPISSLSRRITLFETAVGLRLLDRTTRKLVLTAFGEAYLAQATRLVEEAQRTFDDMVAQGRGPSGFLKVAVPPDHWVPRHLSGIVAEFSRDHENIRLQIDLRPGPVDLAAENYDLAILAEEPRETSLIVRRLAELENGLFASSAYLAAHGTPTHPRDLTRHALILVQAAAGSSCELSRGSDRVALSTGGRIATNSLGLARSLAVSGHGIAAASLVQAAEDLEARRLERVLPDWRLPPTTIHLVTTSRLLPAKARSFIDFVTKRLGPALAAAEGEAPPPRDARVVALVGRG